MSRPHRWTTIAGVFALGTVAYALWSKRNHGTFLKVPYDWRLPTLQRIKDSLWNPRDPRVFVPRVFGVGWSVNLHQLCKRVCGPRWYGRGGEPPAEPPQTVEE